MIKGIICLHCESQETQIQNTELLFVKGSGIELQLGFKVLNQIQLG
jgi:hypothetical protein